MNNKRNEFDEMLNGTFACSILNEVSHLPRRAQELLVALALKYPSKGNYVLEYLLLYDFTYHGCQSPIEILFYIAYMYRILMIGFPEYELLNLHKQAEIVTSNNKRYYADFLINTDDIRNIKIDKPLKLVIECDGHEFHEKTKEQVEKNNDRDFDLKTSGYEVIHFSGSQIYKDPISCANKVIDYALSVVGKVKLEDMFV